MNDAYAVKVLQVMRDRFEIVTPFLLPLDQDNIRRETRALSCAIRALTGKRQTRRDYHLLKTPKYVDRA
jgi:hypothetical protein